MMNKQTNKLMTDGELPMAVKKTNTGTSFRADPDVAEWLDKQENKTVVINAALRVAMSGSADSDTDAAFEMTANTLRENIQQLADLSKVCLMDHAHEDDATKLYARKYGLTQEQAAHEVKIHKYHMFDDQGVVNHPCELVVCSVIMEQLDADINGAYLMVDMMKALGEVREQYLHTPWASLLNEERVTKVNAIQSNDKFAYVQEGATGLKWTARIFEEFGIRPPSE